MAENVIETILLADNKKQRERYDAVTGNLLIAVIADDVFFNFLSTNSNVISKIFFSRQHVRVLHWRVLESELTSTGRGPIFFLLLRATMEGAWKRRLIFT